MGKKICGIATLPGTVKSFMLDNLNFMADNGYDSYCICNSGDMSDNLGKVKHICSEVKWGYSTPVEVVKQIRWYYKVFKKEHFDIIQYATFNAAFPASIAGWLARVPVRINLQWGLSYASAKGWQHILRRTVDKITCMFSTSVQPDSKSNLAYAIKDRLYPERKGYVIFNGSACGVDMKKYDLDKRDEWHTEICEKYDLNEYEHIFGYVGRVIPDKGINELLHAFMNIDNQESCLLLVGSLEHASELDAQIYAKAKTKKNIIFVGPVSNAAQYYAAFDFLLLPSYHEGFGMTVLEAAAMGTPSVVTNIKGPTDFVENDVNGLVCEVKSVESLQDVLVKAIEMPDYDHRRLADNAYVMVRKNFDSEVYKRKFLKNREMLLKTGRNE